MMSDTKLSYKIKEITDLTRRDAGFTLLELLVVIVILGLLIGFVAPAVLRQLGHAKDSVAKQSIEQLGSVLDLYKLDVGSYPNSQDGLQALITKPDDGDNWSGPYVKSGSTPLDPWGHPYLYIEPSTRNGLEYDLCSLGSAGKSGQPGEPGLICNH
jgi:general secretion pathway protein G